MLSDKVEEVFKPTEKDKEDLNDLLPKVRRAD